MKACADLKFSVQHPHRSETAYGLKYRSKEQGVCPKNVASTKLKRFLRIPETC